MEPTQEPTFEESLMQVMQSLPLVIRDYLVEKRYTPVAKAMMTKYGLRIDQAGVLEREIMLLIMGVETPDEFVQSLVDDARIEQNIINNIVQDVNDQIFVPLRKQEEQGGAKVAVPVTSRVSAPSYQPPMPRPAVQQSASRIMSSSLGTAPLPPKMAMPQVARPSTGGTLGDVVRAVTTPKLLEDHEEPYIELAERAPARPARVEVSPENLPGAMPPMPTSPSRAVPSAPTPATIPASFVKEYSKDPYREPVDEPPTA